MPRAVLIAVGGDPDGLELLREHLSARYAAEYDVRAEPSLASATRVLIELADGGHPVAIVLLDGHALGDAAATYPFLTRIAELHPGAKRGALIAVADRPSSDEVLRAAARGLIDFWAVRPWRTPDEEFHGQLSEALREWARANLPPRELVRLVGGRFDARAHELRDLFHRNRIPHASYEAGTPESAAVLDEVGAAHDRLPVVALFDGRVLVEPSNADLAGALGVKTRPDPGLYDVVVIGGGPAGLAASVYGTSEGLRTALLEREAMGGQAGTTSLIRNYLGFPRGVSGSELMQRAYEQAWAFGTEFVYTNEATGLRADGSELVVTLSDGTEVVTRAAILASGVTYRRLGIASIDALAGAGVYHGAAVTEATAVTDEQVYVLGGGNSAGQAAAHLSRFAAHVTVLVRGASLAESMSGYLIADLDRLSNVDIRYGTEVIAGAGDTRLTSLTLRDVASGEEDVVPAAALFVLIGAEPHTDWLPDAIATDRWGYVLTGRDLADADGCGVGWPLERAPLPLETSMPGVFAAGDVRHGSVKRIASAVGEGSIAIRLVHEYLSSPREGVAGRGA